MSQPAAFDVAIVGAGFSGLYLLHKMRALGLTARVYEAGGGVGGTWYWNRYPGARVDIVSHEYSYSFSPELEDDWAWSERYATQPELLKYLNHVADRFDLRRDIQFNTKVVSAHFDDAAGRWTVATDGGETLSARYCVMALGTLSVTKEIDIPGVESFKGAAYHTGQWPHEPVDFTGKRVGVIGTGSSAIQTIPVIAEQAASLHVFQRTPNYTVPAYNGPPEPEVLADWKANRTERRAAERVQPVGMLFWDQSESLAVEMTPEERETALQDRWNRGGFAMGGTFADTAIDAAANAVSADFVARKIRAIVKDPVVAEKLVPKTFPFSTKRMCVDTNYYATFNRPNVTLVDLKEEPIAAITPTGIRTSAHDFAFDAIVYATGFDAMTGPLGRIDVRGRGGLALKEKWTEGPKTYLGLTVAGFPNMFVVTGPGSPSVLSNMVVSIEQHVDWISDCLAWMGARQQSVIEATPEAEDAWVAHVNELAEPTLYVKANSWYMGANVPGKPRVFMPYVGGVGVYREKCDEVAANGYEGFAVSAVGA